MSVPAGSGFVDNPLQKFGFTVQQKLKDDRVVDVAASSKAPEPQHLCGVCGKGCFSPGALATHSAAHSAEEADPLAISVKDFWDLQPAPNPDQPADCHLLVQGPNCLGCCRPGLVWRCLYRIRCRAAGNRTIWAHLPQVQLASLELTLGRFRKAVPPSLWSLRCDFVVSGAASRCLR